MYKLAIAAFALVAASVGAVPNASAQSIDRESVAGGPRAMLTDAGNSRDPNAFSARSRRQMNRIRVHAEHNLARGRVTQQALQAIAQERLVVEGMLASAAADGRIGRRERDAVDNRLFGMRAIADGDVARSPAVYGGGPAR